jgi:lambda family phage portal protein
MSIFDVFKTKPEAPRVKTRSLPIHKRAYAGANTGRLFDDFKSSERSADSELYPAIRRLRSRARDLARNNEYAKRYLTLLKNNVVGDRGFTLQVKALTSDGKLDESGNQAVEDRWRIWGRSGNCTVDGRLSWIEVQKLVIESCARDGEAFIRIHRNRTFQDSISLEIIEPDRVDEELSKRAANGNEIRMGVELNEYKRPVAYHLLSYHPGDYDFTSMSKSPKHIRVPAEQIIHVYMPLRAGQSRGETWFAPALATMKQLGALREAAVVNARVGASKMGFFTSPSGDGFVADDLDDAVPIMEAEPGTFHQLPQGVEFTSFDPQYPSNEFDSFHKACLKGIASGLGISYNSLSNDLESTSYSSIRQGALEERDAYRNMQSFILDAFVRKVYDAWLASTMEMGAIIVPLREYDRFRARSEFRGRAWQWVDPQKEMTAAVLGLKNGILSLQDVAANYGKDVEELLAQIQRDKSLMEQFGVKYALEPYAAQIMPVEADIAGDEGGDVQG